MKMKMKMTPDPRTLYVDRITFHIPDDDPDVVDDHSLLGDDTIIK